MEYIFHYFFQQMICPWISGESNLSVPTDGEFTYLRYSSRLLKMIVCLMLVLLVLGGSLLLRFHNPNDINSISKLFATIELLLTIPLVFSAYYQVAFNEDVVRLRRLLRPTIEIQIADIDRVELIDRGYNYKLVTGSGRTFRLSRFIRGIDRMANKIGAWQLSCGNL